MRILLFATALILSQISFAADQHFEWADYEQAEKSETYLRFSGRSVKVGLLGSTFYGYVKSFDIHSDVHSDSFSHTQVEFKVVDLDTDNSARNEKMWQKCLAQSEHPVIKISISDPILKNKKDQIVHGTIQLRGAEHPIELKMGTEENETSYQVHGQTQISIQETKIPDPSILVAKLDDTIKIDFHLIVAKEGQKK